MIQTHLKTLDFDVSSFRTFLPRQLICLPRLFPTGLSDEL
jgi:hypothetical protein